MNFAFGHPKQANGLDPDPMTAPGQRLSDVAGRTPATAADRRPFVAKYKDAVVSAGCRVSRVACRVPGAGCRGVSGSHWWSIHAEEELESIRYKILIAASS